MSSDICWNVLCQLNICKNKLIFIILYVDNVLLTSLDKGLFKETKLFLFKSFDIKNLGEAIFIHGTKINRVKVMIFEFIIESIYGSSVETV